MNRPRRPRIVPASRKAADAETGGGRFAVGIHLGKAKPRLLVALMGILVFCSAQGFPSSGWAEELLVRPEIPGYQTPDWQTAYQRAAPKPTWQEWLDVGYLAVGLALASWLALRRRSRTGLLLLAVVSLVWLGFWRKGCVCPIGAIQNVAAGLADPAFLVPWSVLVIFLLPLVATLFFGRTFCAAVCPLGAIQELAALRPVRVPNWLEHVLGLVPYVYLGLAVVWAASGAGFLICQYDPFVNFFRLGGDRALLLFGACVLLLGVFVGRPYCRFLCPYGAILGLLAKCSKWHVSIAPEACINCRLCEEACPYGAIQTPSAPLEPTHRPIARRRLAVMLLTLPILVALGAGLGAMLDRALAWMHPTVRLAEQVRLEESAQAQGIPLPTTQALEAFRAHGRSKGQLYAEALRLRRWYRWAGMLLGAWVGLVVGGKLIHLSIYPHRTDYQTDRARCVSCARCFWYCPLEQVRRGWIRDIAEIVPPDRLPPSSPSPSVG